MGQEIGSKGRGFFTIGGYHRYIFEILINKQKVTHYLQVNPGWLLVDHITYQRAIDLTSSGDYRY